MLSWTYPSGAWDLIRLTRERAGYSPRADIGTVLFESPAAGAPTTWLDSVNLLQGQFYYYTLWVRSTVDGLYRRAADTTGLVTKDYGFSNRLYELVPAIYRDKDFDTPAAKLTGKGPLERFLGIFGYELDLIRTESETLTRVTNPDRVSGGLLPLMNRQLGFGFEQELGMRLARIQARNAVHLYRVKGTRIGVEGVVASLTGWAASATQGKNLLLDQNDSSFEESTGRWGLSSNTNTVLGRRNVADAPTVAGPVPVPTGASTGDIGSGSWMLTMTAAAAGSMELQFATGGAWPPMLYGIPVTAGVTYSFSAYARGLTLGRDTYLRMHWYNAAGVYVGSNNSVLTANITTDWVRPFVTATAPAGAFWAGFSLHVQNAAAGEVHLWDALQHEVGGSPSAYQSARAVQIKLAPERRNLAPNPSYEDGNLYTASTGGTAPPTISVSTAQARYGTRSLRADFPAGATTGFFDGYASYIGGQFTMEIGKRYTVSVWVYGATSQLIVKVDGNQGLPNMVPTGEVSGAWSRYAQTYQAAGTYFPQGVHAAQSAGTWPATTYYFDGILVEESASVRPFFSGDTFSAEGEYLWAGTIGNSRTLYYGRRLIKNTRLNARLSEFLPAGSTYALLYTE